MARVHDAYAPELGRLEVQPVGEAVAFQLAEQAKARRSLQDGRADIRSAVTDDKGVQASCESRQLRLSPGVGRWPPPRPESTEKHS